MGEWHTFYRKDGEKISLLVNASVLAIDTAFQRVEIVETATFGRALFLDGSLQSTQVDEFCYHESLAHPALCRIPNPRSVFIAGGGEGALAREVLKHSSVDRVVMVDIDRELVDLAREHLIPWHDGAFEDPRLELIHDDAFATLKTSDETFDLIIIDVTAPKPDNPGALIYTREFFELSRNKLTDNGLLVSQAQSTNVNNLAFYASMFRTMMDVFPHVRPFQANLASDGDCWGYMMAGHRIDEAADVDAILRARNVDDLKLYDGEADKHMFSLPKYVRDALQAPDAHLSTVARPFSYEALD